MITQSIVYGDLFATHNSPALRPRRCRSAPYRAEHGHPGGTRLSLETGLGGQYPVGADQCAIADVRIVAEELHVPGPIAGAGQLWQTVGIAGRDAALCQE